MEDISIVETIVLFKKDIIYSTKYVIKIKLN